MTYFSIIIPAYNRAHLIAQTITTVLSQDHPAFEVIIVDDGSTDNTREVIETNFGANDKVKYFYKRNEERGAARNYGIQQATGDYAIFFDSDDFMKSHYLKTLDKIINDHPDVRFLAAKYNYDNNGIIETHPSLCDLTEGWYDRSLFLTGNMLACNYCIKLKGYSFKWFRPDRELAAMEDWLFLLENLENEKIFIRDEVCVTMRQHDERSMSNNQKVIEARRKATDWALETLNLSPAEKKTLVGWSHHFCGVHEYLDYKRRASIKEAVTAIRESGLHKSFLVLLMKSIAGRKLIDAIR